MVVILGARRADQVNLGGYLAGGRYKAERDGHSVKYIDGNYPLFVTTK